MKYKAVPYNASEGRNLPRYKIQKQYTKKGKWYDVRHNGIVIPFKEEPTKMIDTLNKKK